MTEKAYKQWEKRKVSRTRANAPVRGCWRGGSGSKWAVGWKWKRAEVASPPTQVCTEQPYRHCPHPRHMALTKACWGPGTELWPSLPPGVELGALVWLPCCSKCGVMKLRSAVGRSFHKLESDFALESRILNQINGEHTAVEIRCPGYPTGPRGQPKGETKSYNTVSRSVLQVTHGGRGKCSDRFLGYAELNIFL